MSWPAFLGALEIGLIFGLAGLGVFLSFRVLNFPDLTVDGSFSLGGAVCAILVVSGVNPWLALLAAILAGALAGTVTAFLNLRFNILHLLAGILTSLALYSINLRIMGSKPNISVFRDPTIVKELAFIGLPNQELRPLIAAVIAIVVVLLVVRFLAADYGLAMRATGANSRMARAMGVDTRQVTYVGLAFSNALVALAGALFTQMNGYADATMGVGVIVVGLAAVIIGEAIFGTRSLLVWAIGCVIGSMVYRLAVAAALNADFLGLLSSDLNLVTAVLVVIALLLPGARNPLKAILTRGAAP